MKRRVLTGILVLTLVLALLITAVGCSSGTKPQQTAPEKKNDYPNKPITWVVPWKPGGANDICARLIGPELEKVLGVPVTITNTDGAGGWIGYNMVLMAEADGYTVCNVSLPGLVANYINPEAGRKNTYKDFGLLVNFARDYVTIAIRPDETRFTNMKEMIEYSKTHELTIAGTSGAGDDGVLIAQLNKIEGAKFVHLATTGSSESLTNLYGKHADVCVANVSEIGNPIKAGQIKVVAVAAEKRVKQFPDIPTIQEETGVSIIADSSRGIVTKAGVPEASLKTLRDGLIKALENKELLEKLAAQGIDVEITDYQGYEKIMQDTENSMTELGPKYFGWDLSGKK